MNELVIKLTESILGPFLFKNKVQDFSKKKQKKNKKTKKKTKKTKTEKKKLWDTDFWQYIPEKPHFGPLLGHFWHKNLKTKFYQKTCIRSIVTLYEKKQQQKNKKIRSTNFSENLKTFWAYFCSSVLPILARLTLYFCNLMQKIKKFPWIIWAPKSLVLALSKVRWHPNFRQKKSGSFYEQFWGKTSDRQLKDYIETHFMGPISTRIETIHFDVKLLYCVEVKLRLQLKTPCKCLFYILFLFYTFQFNSW